MKKQLENIKKFAKFVGDNLHSLVIISTVEVAAFFGILSILEDRTIGYVVASLFVYFTTHGLVTILKNKV